MEMRDSAQLFLKFLGRGGGEQAQQAERVANGRIGVVISPWVNTPVPWFSMTLAFLLKKKGYQPFFIWDDLGFEQDIMSTLQQNEPIGEVLEKCASWGWETIILSRMQPVPSSEEEARIIEKSALLNAQWIQASAVPTQELENVRAHCHKQLTKNAPYIAGLLENAPFDMLLVPGGVYRNSGLFLHMAQLRGVNVSTYDSGNISMAVGYNSVAACFDDLPATHNTVLDAPVEIKRHIVSSAKEEFFKRLMGKDKYTYQQSKVGKSVKKGSKKTVFIPLNIETDATALGLSSFFTTSWDWLTQTVAFLLDKTDATIFVRQHPYEVKKSGGQLLLPNKLKQIFNSDRFILYSCYDTTNSYDLLSSADLVLPYVSTMGIEAVMLGKEIIMESKVYYAGMNFAPQASSKEDYFNRIASSLNKEEFAPSSEMLESAWIAYFLSALCGRIWTEFTPQPQNFDKWVQGSLQTLLNDSEIDSLLSALSGVKTVTEIQYQKFLRSISLKNERKISATENDTMITGSM